MYTVLVVAGLVVSCVLVVIAFQQGRITGSKALVLVSAASAIWSMTSIFMLTSHQLAATMFWYQAGFLSIVALPVAWFVLSLNYAGFSDLITGKSLLILIIIPVITLGLTWTNSAHHLIWQEIELVASGAHSMLTMEYSSWYWFFYAYSSVLLLSAAFLFIRKLLQSSNFGRLQVYSILVAAVIPVLGSIVNLPDLNPVFPLDLFVFFMIVSQTAYLLANFDRRRMEIIPSAQSTVVEGMVDGVIVIDTMDQVVDINQSAAVILDANKENLIGLSVQEVISRWTGESQQGIDLSLPLQEIQIVTIEGQTKWISIKTAKLEENLAGEIGKVVILHDTSDQRKMTLEKQELQKFLIKLIHIAQVAVSSVEIVQMLQTMADQIGEMFKADGCIIMRWEEREQLEIPLAASGAMKDNFLRMRPLRGENTLLASMVSEGGLLVIEDLQPSSSIGTAITDRFSFTSMLAFPLITRQETIGSLCIGYKAPHSFSPSKISQAELVARLISLAVSRLISLEMAENRAEESEAYLNATAAVASSQNLRETIDRILAQLENLLVFDAAFVQLRDGIVLKVVGGRGSMVTDRRLNLRFPLSGSGPSTYVFRSKESLIIGNIRNEVVEISQPFPDWVVSWMGVPLVSGNKVIGLLTLESGTQNHFDAESLKIVSPFVNNIAIAVQSLNIEAQVQSLEKKDELTGLYNRQQFMEIGNLELQRARRYWHPLSVIMIDIDHFKEINTAYGHTIGDEVLRSLANNCLSRIREVDIMGRYGGEEFAILLPETDSDTAYQTAERLLSCANENPVRTKAGSVSFTISAGVAEFDLKMGGLETLMFRANSALNRAKENGRNQVFSAGSDTGPPGK